MITIIGVTHISKKSVKEVEDAIDTLNPDLIAVELCYSRYKGLTEGRKIPIWEYIKNKNSTMLLVNILLSFLQTRLGSEVGTKPGKEMLTAIDMAKERNTPFVLIDRDIQVTIKRAMAKIGLIEKIRVFKELLLTTNASKDEIEEEISKIKNVKNIQGILTEFEKISPSIFQVLVKERDAFMANNILNLDKRFKNILVVIGAGHEKGLQKYLSNPGSIPSIEELVNIPKKTVTLTRVLKFGLPLFIVAMFVYALLEGVSIRGAVYLWVLNHMVPTSIAIILARGSLPALAAGTIASPLTSLNPFLAAGWFAGVAEMKYRNVTVDDVSDMFKINHYPNLMKNNAFKVLLVTAMANIGSMIGTFLSLPTIILPLIRSITG